MNALEKQWLDSSRVDLYKLCPRKYYWRHIRNLVPQCAPYDSSHSSALAFGSAIHACLDMVYRLNSDEIFDLVPCPLGDCSYCEPFAGRGISRLAACFLNLYPINPPPEFKDPRTIQTALQLLTVYLEKWARSDQLWKVEAVEVPFQLDITEDLTYTGRIDLLVRDQDGTLMPIDHKTARRFGDDWFASFKLSGQLSGYIYATQELTGEPVQQALVNAIRVSSKIESRESFARKYCPRRPDEIGQWKYELITYHEDIKRCTQRNFFPKAAPVACTSWGRLCEYFDLCSTNGEQLDNLINQNFEVQPWDPLGLDPKKPAKTED